MSLYFGPDTPISKYGKIQQLVTTRAITPEKALEMFMAAIDEELNEKCFYSPAAREGILKEFISAYSRGK